MNLTVYKESLAGTAPPPGLNIFAQALWWDAKDDWEKAHTLIQDLPGKNAAWIHAYLHRKEGDTGNADYWYRIAGKKRPAHSLAEEWAALAEEMLD